MDQGGPGRRGLQAAHGLAGVTGREVRRRGRFMGSVGDGNCEAGKAAGDVV